jgi:hypothetical protein
MKSKAGSKYLTFKEAAEFFDLAESTVRERYAAMGLVTVQVFPGRKGRRFLRRHLEQLASRLDSEGDHLLRAKRETLRLAG